MRNNETTEEYLKREYKLSITQASKHADAFDKIVSCGSNISLDRFMLSTGKTRCVKIKSKQSCWTIERVESLGFKLIVNDKMRCHFRGHNFDVTVNLDMRVVNGNHFNFKSYKNNFLGNFSAVINTEKDFEKLLALVCVR